MIYNGDDKWTAPVNIESLIKENDVLGDYGLHFKYFKIAENEYSSESLLKIKNIVSTLFLAEVDYDIDLLTTEMLNLFDNEDDKQAVSIFLNWFRILSENGKIKEEDYEKLEELYKDKGEVSSMLVTALKKEKLRIREDALIEGEDKKEIEIVNTMYEQGMSKDSISKFTKISLEKINRIIDKK